MGSGLSYNSPKGQIWMLQKYLQLFGFGILYFTCVCCRKAMGRWALHLSAGLGLLAVLLMSSYAEGKLHSYINILLFLSATHPQSWLHKETGEEVGCWTNDHLTTRYETPFNNIIIFKCSPFSPAVSFILLFFTAPPTVCFERFIIDAQQLIGSCSRPIQT